MRQKNKIVTYEDIVSADTAVFRARQRLAEAEAAFEKAEKYFAATLCDALTHPANAEACDCAERLARHYGFVLIGAG